MLQVPREVQDEGARHIGDAGRLLPQGAVVGVGFDLPAKRTQVSVENGGNRLQQQRGAQCPAPWLVER
jgi:hypothetical protein